MTEFKFKFNFKLKLLVTSDGHSVTMPRAQAHKDPGLSCQSRWPGSGWTVTAAVTRRGDTGLQVGRRPGPQDGSYRRTTGAGRPMSDRRTTDQGPGVPGPGSGPAVMQRTCPAGPWRLSSHKFIASDRPGIRVTDGPWCPAGT